MKLRYFINGVVRSNLISQEPFPDLNRAYQSLVQEERSQAISRGKELQEQLHAFHVHTEKGRGKLEKVDKSKLLCTHCKLRGHEKSTCFKIHGYPDWWEERQRIKTANGGSHFNASTTVVGSNSRGRGGARANVVVESAANAQVMISLAALSPEQMRVSLLRLLITSHECLLFAEYA